MKKYWISIEKARQVNLLEFVAHSGYFDGNFDKIQRPLNIDELQDQLMCNICDLSDEALSKNILNGEAAKIPSIINIHFGGYINKSNFGNEPLRFGFETTAPLIFVVDIEIVLEDNTTSENAEKWILKHIVDANNYIISYHSESVVDHEEAERLRIKYICDNQK